MSRFLLLIACLAFAWPALAGFNFQYPRTRLFSDIGRGDIGYEPSDRRSRPPGGTSDRDFTVPEAYDTTQFRAGAWGRYNYQYHWRDYRITTSGWIFGSEVYAQFFGLEASVFVVADAADKMNVGNPIQTNYRLSYTLKYENSINTIAYTYQDWSKSAGRIATNPTVAQGQGFGIDAQSFEKSSNELYLSSYWFPERVQLYNANYFFGMDAWTWLDGPGLRAMASIGVLANAQQAQYGLNGARLQVGLIGQINYHRKGTSWPGANFMAEIYRDMREEGLPLMAVAGIEYYLPFGRDPADAITFSIRLELVF